MKNNTAGLKICILQALKNTPEDFALQEVRGLLSRALQVVENVESKRGSRQKQRLERKENKLVSSQSSVNVLQNIENELMNEKRKLEDIQKKKSQSFDLPDNQEMQNVFG